MKLINDQIIKSKITEEINNQNTVFVFSTQISATMWADQSLSFSGRSCVAMERFIAWDDFKGSSIRSQHQDKTSIPSNLRSIFAENIVLQNSKNPFFKSIITQEYAESAIRFASWIEGILPGLAMWKRYAEKARIVFDEEDEDLLELYNRYNSFLESNNLFDPAWETPPFNSNGKKYVIFFPEILMDYTEYKDILESTGDIELVHIPDDVKQIMPEGHFYSNTRIELKEAVHYLYNIHREKNIPWNRIAISVPDMDSYGPYLERELELYQIPHVQKNGKSLCANGAGNFFNQILECYGDNFSYDSIKNLLLNREVPWKAEELNNLLIQFGRENNCICSYEENGTFVDVWEQSFKSPKKFDVDVRLHDYYKTLKKSVTNIVKAESFKDIRSAYFAFRENMFDFSKDDYPEENDRILSRCISELGTLIDLEEKFSECPEFTVSSPFSFFCSYITNKNYVPQKTEEGVQILPYKTAACAPFDVHVVLDASQNGISVVYKQLSFLRDDKRKKIGFADDSNITQNFIILYAMNAQTDFLFTCAEKTIDAFAFTNSYLEEKDHRPGKKFSEELFSKDDSYRNEKTVYLDGKEDLFPKTIYKIQKDGFDLWKELNCSDEIKKVKNSSLFTEKVQSVLVRNNKVKVSVTDMNRFFVCPRMFMFKRVLGVEQADNAATLVDRYAMGSLNHLIMEFFLSALKEKDLRIKFDEEKESVPEEYKKILDEAVLKAIHSCNESQIAQELFETTDASIRNAIYKFINVFSRKFNDYAVWDVEQEYIYEPEGKKYFFKAKVDCLLASPDGEFVLLDFKNTENSFPKDNAYYDAETESVPAFQLPVYKYIIENQTKAKKISACGYFEFKEGKSLFIYSDVNEIVLGKNYSNERFEFTENKCIEFADVYAEKVSVYDFDPAQVSVDFETCSACTYKSVCRKTFTVSPNKD